LVFVFSSLLLLVFYLLNFFLSLKEDYFNKSSSFESGFVRVGLIQNSFRIHFFIIMLIFVIFDLEIVMFLGVLISDINFFLGFFFILLFIIGCFYIE